ncbi:DinB family protein [Peribacillus psychrosaccharolyticus]|uniref:DinB family protein n=1 Tax=Peribacillus psychrosaccharolyticus TaxID=1407 RepID=UPI003D2DBD56
MLSMTELLEILEGNRKLSIRTIEAFPEDELFTFTAVESMRPYSEMVQEVLGIETGYVRGIATSVWDWQPDQFDVQSKADLLAACHSVRNQTIELWEKITEERLALVESDPFFGPPTSHFSRLLYCLENEIHHRGQGFVYLRALGIEPPMFFER